ncbi:DUF1989 domain-containing protein [Bacillus kexueae]|uniref:DUF1989 domain-containing protein n=1 Tax=Aeribacillus kexueae TaxID=2078952 RepID=UPI001FAEFE70|nr:urea carboxylase-associated family protein [Bacillus kexueae]
MENRLYHIIPAEHGAGFHLHKGETIRIIDQNGEQVADFVAVSRENEDEVLDPGATMDAMQKKDLQIGDKIYSNYYRPMFTITKDKVGKHDLLLPACRKEMYELLYNKENHANCFDNLNDALKAFSISPLTHHRPFNIFMNTVVDADGQVKVERPLSEPEDYIELRAEMDLVVAVSACPTSESSCNGFEPSPIRIEIF